MATSPNRAALAELADKRANPTGKTSTQMTRELKEKQAAKTPMPMPNPPVSSAQTPEQVMQEAADAKGYARPYKKGGSIDGVAKRGKTRGKMC